MDNDISNKINTLRLQRSEIDERIKELKKSTWEGKLDDLKERFDHFERFSNFGEYGIKIGNSVDVEITPYTGESENINFHECLYKALYQLLLLSGDITEVADGQ